MDAANIIKLRLYNSGLLHPPFKTPAEAVAHFGAVQAQDFPAARWSLGLRIRNSSDADILDAYNAGAILRTHVMRPTWHFVTPLDLRWLLALTAPRIKAFAETPNRRIGIDAAMLARSNAAIVTALEQKDYLTRDELKTTLSAIGVETDTQRLAHIIMHAEVSGLICSGPMRGKQFTYALLEKRVPKAPVLDREQALARLASTYFRSHGPAQLEDFTWWSGLPIRDARLALELVKSGLDNSAYAGKTYWFPPPPFVVKMPPAPFMLLLSLYDEYVIAYRDRSVINPSKNIAGLLTSGSTYSAVILTNGVVTGTWKRALEGKAIAIRLSPFADLKPAEKAALEAQVARYGAFAGMETISTWT